MSTVNISWFSNGDLHWHLPNIDLVILTRKGEAYVISREKWIQFFLSFITQKSFSSFYFWLRQVNIWSWWRQFGLSWYYWDSVLKHCFNNSSFLGSVLRQATFSLFQTSRKCRKIHADDQWFLINVVVCCIFCLFSFIIFDSCFSFSLCNSGKSFINFSLLFLFVSLSFSFKISLFFSRYLFYFSAFESFFSPAGFLPILLARNTISLTQIRFFFTCSTRCHCVAPSKLLTRNDQVGQKTRKNEKCSSTHELLKYLEQYLEA